MNIPFSIRLANQKAASPKNTGEYTCSLLSLLYDSVKYLLEQHSEKRAISFFCLYSLLGIFR